MSSIIENLQKIELRYNSKIPKYEWKETKRYSKDYNKNNYGILTGKINNLTVVDLDFHKFKNKNNEYYQNFINLFSNDFIQNFNTFTVKTANKGYHLYFKYDKEINTTTNRKYQIDIRSDGAYVVGPNSKLDFNEYTIVNNVKIQKLPLKLKHFLKTKILKKNKNVIQRKRILKNVIDTSEYKYDISKELLNLIISKLPKSYFTNYSDWLKFTTFMKILNKQNLWDKTCSKYRGYEQQSNFYIWDNLKYKYGIVQDILKTVNMSYKLPYIIYKNGISDEKKPDKIINRQKLGVDFIKNNFKSFTNKCLIIKSDTGTGKTYSTKQYFKQNLDNPFISIVSRCSLGQEQYKNFNDGLLSCLYYKDYFLFDEDNQDDNIIITIDSILKLDLDFKNYTIYLDEWSSIIEYLLLSSTLNNKRIIIFSKLLNILSECKSIICTDADINDLCFKFFDFLNIEYKFIENKYKHNNDIKSEEILNENKFIELVKKQDKFIICCDSKKTSEQLFKILNDDEIKLITKETKEYIDLDLYDKIIYTPKIIYGLDSSMSRNVFCYYKQCTISARNMLQQVCRCRNIKKLYYLFMNKRVNNSTYNNFEECVNDTIFQNKIAGIEYGIKADERLNDLYTFMFSWLTYNNDCKKVNKFKHFKILLKQRGFIDENKKGLTLTENKKQINKELKEERLEKFTINADFVKNLNKYLRIPNNEIEDYKEIFIDNFKLFEHFSISNLLFKDSKDIFNSVQSRLDFNINKLSAVKNKILIIKNILKKYNVNIHNLDFTSIDFDKKNLSNITNIFNYKKPINNKLDLQKFINLQLSNLTNTKIFNKKRIDRRLNKKRYRLYQYKINENELNYHKKLFEYRQIN